MGSVIVLLVIVLIALLIVQTGTNALLLTGMSLAVARFQAASAFFGVGFTTQEAEMVVNHPVRRRIILLLIVSGNIGLTSALATLIVTFVSRDAQDGMHWGTMIGCLLLGILVLAVFMNLPFVRNPLDVLMRLSLERAGVVRAVDYELLLKVRHGFCVSDFEVEKDHPVAGLALMESRLNDYGIVVLGIYRHGGEFTGVPPKEAVIDAGDVIMVYGSEDAVNRLAKGELRKVRG